MTCEKPKRLTKAREKCGAMKKIWNYAAATPQPQRGIALSLDMVPLKGYLLQVGLRRTRGAPFSSGVLAGRRLHVGAGATARGANRDFARPRAASKRKGDSECSTSQRWKPALSAFRSNPR